jgi:hypothetical protein
LGPFSGSPSSQSDQVPSAIAISVISPQTNSDVADTDVPTPMEIPHDLHQTARSGPDLTNLTTDVSLGTTPSLHGVDRSQ